MGIALKRAAANGAADDDAAVFESQTVPELFLQRVYASAGDLAYEYQDAAGTWIPVTYDGYGELVQSAALQLSALGIAEDTCVAIWGNTMAEWAVLSLAAQVAGGHVAGIYQTSTPEQAVYIIQDSGAQVLCADTWERVQSLAALRDQIPTIKRIVVWSGDVPADAPEYVTRYSYLLAEGRKLAENNADAFEELAAKVRPDQKAVLVYTSGTTGMPKGVILTHGNLMTNVRNTLNRELYAKGDSMVAFLPMSHVAEYTAFLGRLLGGVVSFFCPDFYKVADAMRAKSPTLVVAVPRVYEKVHQRIVTMIETSPPRKKQIFWWGFRTGQEVAALKAQKKAIPLGLSVRYGLADRLVLSKVRTQLGGRVRAMISAAAPIDIEIIEFFRAFGIEFLEAYGLSESCGASHINLPGDFKVGTVGKPIKGLECCIAEDGEILMRGPTIFTGYLNKPEETREMLDDDGWLHTGDIGTIDEDGFLRITDRKKNLLITAGGKNVAPAGIEVLIKRDPVISQVVVLGDRKPFLVALITIAQDVVKAEQLTPEQIEARVKKAIDEANTKLPRHETIKRFRVLEREFDIVSGEMTPTHKIKRNVVVQHYQDLIDQMYEGGGE